MLSWKRCHLACLSSCVPDPLLSNLLCIFTLPAFSQNTETGAGRASAHPAGGTTGSERFAEELEGRGDQLRAEKNYPRRHGLLRGGHRSRRRARPP